jgi:hypothetical protein
MSHKDGSRVFMVVTNEYTKVNTNGKRSVNYNNGWLKMMQQLLEQRYQFVDCILVENCQEAASLIATWSATWNKNLQFRNNLTVFLVPLHGVCEYYFYSLNDCVFNIKRLHQQGCVGMLPPGNGRAYERSVIYWTDHFGNEDFTSFLSQLLLLPLRRLHFHSCFLGSATSIACEGAFMYLFIFVNHLSTL